MYDCHLHIIVVMTKTQIQLPDAVYEELKALSDRLEVSMAELLRRGAEYVLRVHRAGETPPARWMLPEPLSLGAPLVPADQWREYAAGPAVEDLLP
jgi:hypothetical protein